MMVMTAKVDFKKILLILTGAAALILAAILLLGGGEENAASTAAPSVSGNEGRVQFLRLRLGCDRFSHPVRSGEDPRRQQRGL